MDSRKIAIAAVVVAGAAPASALAAQVTQAPATLVLQRADFPARVQYQRAPLPAAARDGMAGTGEDFYANIGLGGRNVEQVTGFLVVTPSSAQARVLFGRYASSQLKRDRQSTSARTLRLPSYGSPQEALLGGTFPFAEVLACKGSVVWQLAVRGPLSRTKLVSALKTYAREQRTRVGSGS